MCIVNENGDEDFQNVMKEIGRKDHTIQNGLFQVFDFIPLDEFNKGISNISLSGRLNALKIILSQYESLKFIKLLEQLPLFSFEELDAEKIL